MKKVLLFSTLFIFSIFSCSESSGANQSASKKDAANLTSLLHTNEVDRENPLLKKVLYNKVIRANNPVIKVMSYNIQAGSKDENGTVNIEITAEAIKKVNPDIAALQEVDVMTGRSGGMDQVEELAYLTGYYSCFGKTIDYDGGEYGIAVLSKHPILDYSVIPLTSSDEQRIALITKIDVPNFEVPITFINTHLDWHEDPTVRMKEIYEIDQRLLDFRGIKIMCGDFNDVMNSDVIKHLNRYWTLEIPQTADHRTWPSKNPEVGLDYIFTSKAQKWQTQIYIPNGENDSARDGIEWNLVSDHIPVIATMKLLEQ